MHQILAALDTSELVYVTLVCLFIIIRLFKVLFNTVRNIKKRRQQRREETERLEMPVDWEKEERMIFEEYIDYIASQRNNDPTPSANKFTAYL